MRNCIKGHTIGRLGTPVLHQPWIPAVGSPRLAEENIEVPISEDSPEVRRAYLLGRKSRQGW